MARWENEDISKLNLPDPQVVSKIFIDKNANETTNEDSAFAKVTECDGKKNHYIKYNRGAIVDPHHVDFNSRNNSNSIFRKVSDKAFSNYCKFLESKNVLYFTMARRMVMEGR